MAFKVKRFSALPAYPILLPYLLLHIFMSSHKLQSSGVSENLVFLAAVSCSGIRLDSELLSHFYVRAKLISKRPVSAGRKSEKLFILRSLRMQHITVFSSFSLLLILTFPACSNNRFYLILFTNHSQVFMQTDLLKRIALLLNRVSLARTQLFVPCNSKKRYHKPL